jgi:hypothetical protein
MKFIRKVMQMQVASASSVPNTKMPISIPVTLSADENSPQTNKLRVSPAAWNMEPEEESIICTPTERLSI